MHGVDGVLQGKELSRCGPTAQVRQFKLGPCPEESLFCPYTRITVGRLARATVISWVRTIILHCTAPYDARSLARSPNTCLFSPSPDHALTQTKQTQTHTKDKHTHSPCTANPTPSLSPSPHNNKQALSTLSPSPPPLCSASPLPLSRPRPNISASSFALTAHPRPEARHKTHSTPIRQHARHSTTIHSPAHQAIESVSP